MRLHIMTGHAELGASRTRSICRSVNEDESTDQDEGSIDDRPTALRHEEANGGRS
jgi:hypothetical protein